METGPRLEHARAYETVAVPLRPDAVLRTLRAELLRMSTREHFRTTSGLKWLATPPRQAGHPLLA